MTMKCPRPVNTAPDNYKDILKQLDRKDPAQKLAAWEIKSLRERLVICAELLASNSPHFIDAVKAYRYGTKKGIVESKQYLEVVRKRKRATQ